MAFDSVSKTAAVNHASNREYVLLPYLRTIVLCTRGDGEKKECDFLPLGCALAFGREGFAARGSNKGRSSIRFVDQYSPTGVSKRRRADATTTTTNIKSSHYQPLQDAEW